MNISELKVGMRVTNEYWGSYKGTDRVVFLGKNISVLEDMNGHEYVAEATNGWIEVPKKKLPSDRIREILRERAQINFDSEAERMLDGITNFLDETMVEK